VDITGHRAWKRHISLDKCPIGETKESIGIHSKNGWDRVADCSIWTHDQGIIAKQRFRDYYMTIQRLEHEVV
jgi:hypothetical protein